MARIIDQPPPSWDHDGLGMHVLVMTDLTCRNPQHDRRFSGTSAVRDAVIMDLEERREVGLGRYGTELQAWNGRDWRIDLYQELQDAVCYARQGKEESDPASLDWIVVDRVYEALIGHLLDLRRMIGVKDIEST